MALAKEHQADAVGRWWPEVLALAVLLLAVLLRAGWPRLTEFKFSEARLAALALELTREGRLPLVGVPSSAGFDHSPLSVYLYVPAFAATTNPIPATIYGGLVGAAAVALAWWLARSWPGGGRWAALVTALTFATSPWGVLFSRKIWQVAFVPLLALAAVALLLSALAFESRPRPWHLAWSLALLAVLVQVHPSAVTLLPAVLLWLVVFWRRVRLASLLAGAALGLFTAVPFLAHQVRAGWPLLAAYRALPAATWDLAAPRLAWQAITGQGIEALAGRSYPELTVVPALVPLLAVLGWLVVASVLWLAWRTAQRWRAAGTGSRETARVDLVLLTWLIVPVVLNLRHNLDLYLHFFALVLPAAYLILGRAVQDVVLRLPRRGRRAASVALGGGVLLLAGLQVIVLGWLGAFVAGHNTEGGFGLPLGSYLDLADAALSAREVEEAAEIVVAGPGDSVVVDEVPAIWDVLLRGRAGYRFVDGQTAALFPAQRAVAVLAPQAGAAADWYAGWPGRDLAAGYRLVSLDGSAPRGLAAIDSPRLFENGVELQSYRWQPAHREFWLLWQVLWQNPDDTHFTVRLLDGASQTWGQGDGPGYPVAYRRKGDRVLSQFYITENQPEQGGEAGATLRAEVGQYLYPQVVPVQVLDGAGNPAGQTVPAGPLAGE